jgi:Ca2+ transporting ATPase
MSVLVRGKSAKGSNVLYVKGAPESILERCSQVRLSSGSSGADSTSTAVLTNPIRKKILDIVHQWGTTESLRVLALATVDRPKQAKDYDLSDCKKFATYEKDMVFVGLVGMRDPPRQEVRDAIEICHNAGIRVIVITGDNKVRQLS